MPNSYNGWSASPNPRDIGITPLVVAGEPFSPGVRGGDVHTVLGYVAEQLHRRVEPIVRGDWHQADDWGYAYRQNRNANNLSCHASGTAIDYNATRHPNSKRGTWTGTQKAEIARILAEVNHTVRNLANDEMHFEIVGNAAQVAAAAAKVRGGGAAPAPSPEKWGESVDAAPGTRVLGKWAVGSDVAFVQRWLGVKDDGYFGDDTEARVKWYQGQRSLEQDGIVGPATWAQMGIGVVAPPAPVAPPVSDGLLREGDSGPAVERVQTRLRDSFPAYRHEHGNLGVDGDFGPRTKAWVMEFQGRSGLAVDGIVGPDTLRALGL